MMKSSNPAPVMLGPDEGQSLSVIGDTYRLLITGNETDKAFATIDMLIPPGGGPGPHSHAGFAETFYVIEGEVEVYSEASVYTAKKGSCVVIPKGGAVHNFKNKTDQPAQLLCLVVPSGLEEMFMEIGHPVAAGEFLPPPPMTPEAEEKLKQVAEKYGQKVYPPDYLDNA